MRYESDDHTVVEYLWNSRDGVTPFIITAKDGKTQLSHTNWKQDERRPNHKPMPGDRIFVDLTEEQFKAYRGHQWDLWYADKELVSELIATYGNKANFLARSSFNVGEPDIKMISYDSKPMTTKTSSL